ncbi:unnamed protein product [Ciceribacter selenitireducens ATCC BAA-1503]|uniref:Uncharacterized protein n=1 Tax=Ciceribacter selenitireducens ATCC BAA-1503 TaxID=1336235 RepID=A0A376AKX6_9HYPH|nr:unnamed protein product [Ciceribacter selenitireducens ATCC BAA-1503]
MKTKSRSAPPAETARSSALSTISEIHGRISDPRLFIAMVDR